MKEYQIVVRKLGKDYWYTAYRRNVYFLFRSSWKAINPMYQSTYEEAELQIDLDSRL